MKHANRAGWLPLAAILIFLAAAYWAGRPVRWAPGPIAPDNPEQEKTGNDIRPIVLKAHILRPLASFHMKARVLSAENYYFDRPAKICRRDVAFGWGPMSDQQVLDKIRSSQSGRFYFWNCRKFPIPRKEIETHSANMHLIGANRFITRTINRLRKGSLAELDGYLVMVEASDGFKWQSSLRRDDTGNGACEVVYVKKLEIL